MLKILDKVASIVTNIIVVATTITTTLLVPVFLYQAIRVMRYTDVHSALMCLLSVFVLVKINHSIQGGR